MNIIKKIAYSLVIIGALNWGLVGLVSIDLVQFAFGSVLMLARIVYVLVGLSALYLLLERFSAKSCNCCDTCSCGPQKSDSVIDTPIKTE